MAHFLPVDEQMSILMRGVDFGDQQTYKNMQEELRQRLQESYDRSQPLKVYCGFDPSRPDLHLGHTVPLRKLRQFQDLGHHVVFLIGTFTGLIGDPSDRDSLRPQQTLAEAQEKARTYAEQCFRVLDAAKTEIRYNHEWLGELSFAEVIKLASNFTVQQFLTRENFAKRHDKGDPIWLHEFFYALMQGYDAVALATDVQIGGTDQLFNLMAGRKLMEAFQMRPQVILTFPILVGTDGMLRMSKSTGNYIGISEAPGVIYTKVLNVPDSAMRNYAELVTRWSQTVIDERFRQIADATLAMRDFKHQLAHEIVSIFHGEAAAERAAEDAGRMHQGEAPSDAPLFVLTEGKALLDLLVESGLAKSKGEGRRLIEQGGVRLDGQPVTTFETTVTPTAGGEVILQVGKRKFLRVQAG
jgi:tyrosyl-tRNA synthetase